MSSARRRHPEDLITETVGPQTFTAAEGVDGGGEVQDVHVVVKAVCTLTPTTPGKE